MVFLRLEVKVFIAEQVDGSRILPSVFQNDFGDDGSQTSCCATFLLTLKNPEQLSMGDLAHLIKEKWNTLRPDCEPLIVKKLLDDAMPLIDLELGMSVADAFVDYGKAHADGYDQRAAVRVIHNSDNYCPGERFPSLVQDFEGAAEAYAQREAEKLFAKASSPIPGESNDVSIHSIEAPITNYVAPHSHAINSPQFPHTANAHTTRSQDEDAGSRKRKRTKSRDHTPAKAPRLEVQPKETTIKQPLNQVSVSPTRAKPGSETSRSYLGASTPGKMHQPLTPSNSQTRDPPNDECSQPVHTPKPKAKPKAKKIPHLPQAEQTWLIEKAKALLTDSTTDATLMHLSKEISSLVNRLNEESDLSSEVEVRRREARKSNLAHRLSKLQKILGSAKNEPPAMPVEVKNTNGHLHQDVDQDPKPVPGKPSEQVMVCVEIPPETDTEIKKEDPEEERRSVKGKEDQEATAPESIVFTEKEWLKNDFILHLTQRTDVCNSEYEGIVGIDQPKKENDEFISLATDGMAPPIHPAQVCEDDYPLQEVLALMRRTQNVPWPQ
ncbi:hypothetical protein N7528_001325 [Penicillium herquei]|nr:hypothetical protein N7528_001325 [Penicillium herquei]